MALKERVVIAFQEKISAKIKSGELPIKEAYVAHLHNMLGLTMVTGTLGELHNILLQHFNLTPEPDIENVIWWSKSPKSNEQLELPPNPVKYVSNASPRMYQPTSKKNSDGEPVNKSD